MREQWIPGPFLRFFEWAWVRGYSSTSTSQQSTTVIQCKRDMVWCQSGPAGISDVSARSLTGCGIQVNFRFINTNSRFINTNSLFINTNSRYKYELPIYKKNSRFINTNSWFINANSRFKYKLRIYKYKLRIIREQVDSLCRIGADTQYMQYLSKNRTTSPQIR